jgi:hypothetical protein
MVVYILKISALKSLLLKNGEIYNAWIPAWLPLFLVLGCLYCNLNISTREQFLEAEILGFFISHLGLYTSKMSSKSVILIEQG